MSRSRRMPRPPTRLNDRDVSAWMRYYERMEKWHRDTAALLGRYPDTRAYTLNEAARFRQGVTELLIGAHWCQLTGQWS